MTASPPDTDAAETEEQAEDDPTLPGEEARALAEALGGEAVAAHSIIKIAVDPERWVDSVTAARDAGFAYFSWLSAIDWTTDVAVGDPPSDEDLEHRIEVLCAVSDLSDGRLVVLSTTIDHTDPRLASVTSVYSGADWHEREAAEMFGIVFEGHPRLQPLYLPDGFHGHPLRKSFRLLSREVKPWPGKVDVEAMPDDEEDGDGAADADGPSTENPEA